MWRPVQSTVHKSSFRKMYHTDSFRLCKIQISLSVIRIHSSYVAYTCIHETCIIRSHTGLLAHMRSYVVHMISYDYSDVISWMIWYDAIWYVMTYVCDTSRSRLLILLRSQCPHGKGVKRSKSKACVLGYLSGIRTLDFPCPWWCLHHSTIYLTLSYQLVGWHR